MLNALTIRWSIALCVLLGTFAYAGDLVVIGGGLRSLNAGIYSTIIERLQNDTVCILGVANSDPAAEAQSYVNDFIRYGATPVIVDITEENALISTSDDTTLEQLASCGGYFFTGGSDQRRITDAFLNEGQDTPALATLRARFEAGAVIAGTSAGAAALSGTMIGGGSSVDTLLVGENTVSLEPGLGFVDGVILDQHFFKFGRLGRLLGALVETDVPLGAGVGEDTALVIPETGPWEVLGTGHVALVEMPEGATLEALSNVLISLLAGGDSFDPRARTFSVRLERNNTEEIGYYFEAGDLFAVDAFGPGVLADLMTRLIDSPERGASGLGFVGNSAARFQVEGVRLMLTRGEQTQGYWGRIEDAENYSVIRVELAVEPIVVNIEPRSLNADSEEGVADGERTP